MTKVKTILAEFCTPKEILAINRLGLIKKEERESQPIPWRHRLPNARILDDELTASDSLESERERRKLVKSEMRTSLRPTVRLTARDKAKAVGTAKSPKDSKMGECLLNIHIRGDPRLGPHLGKLFKEQRQLAHSHEQTRQTFMKNSQTLNHEPLILVERPPSPKVRSRALIMTHHGVDPDATELPSYMRPLHTRNKTPSTLTTIDAFTVEAKKKRNVWEEAMDQKEGPKFKSTAKPCARLTELEISQLKIGYTLHKPTPESIATPRAEAPRELPSPPPNPPPRQDSEDGPSVFITQLNSLHLMKRDESKSSRVLRFSDMTDSQISESVSGESQQKGSHSAGTAERSSRMRSKSPRVGREKGTPLSAQSYPLLSGRETSERKLNNFLNVLLETGSSEKTVGGKSQGKYVLREVD